MTAPVTLYTDPAVFARERTAIFAKAWLILGLEADLTRAGDYMADTLADYPVMVARAQGGELRGFHNVCRHRAGPLVGEGKGRLGERALVCRYHSWRYDLDGRLQNTGDFGMPDGFDPDAFGLLPIRVETWRGFVFINMDLGAAPLVDTLRPLDGRFGATASLPARLQHSHAIACNWKVYVENYLDGYHLEGDHPVAAGASGAHRHAVRVDGMVALHEAAPDVSGEGLWAWVWPNLGFCLYRGVLLVEYMRPEGPHRMRLEHLYLHEPEDPGIDAAMSTSERIADEDAWVSERVQRNLAAGIYREGLLSSEHEGAVAWFQTRVMRALDEG